MRTQANQTEQPDGPLSALLDACKAASGQTGLARALNLRSQGTISGWIRHGRVPAERVLQVEEATGVSRHRLRPDLYPLEKRA